MGSNTSVPKRNRFLVAMAIFFAALILGSTIGLYWTWTRLSALIILRKFVAEAGIPVEVEAASWDVRWRELLNGKIRDLHLEVYYKSLDARIVLDTPVNYTRHKNDWSIELKPKLTLGDLPTTQGVLKIQLEPKKASTIDLHLHETRPLEISHANSSLRAEHWSLDGWVQWTGQLNSEIEAEFDDVKLDLGNRTQSLATKWLKIHADTGWPSKPPLPLETEATISSGPIEFLGDGIFINEQTLSAETSFRFDGRKFTAVDISVDNPLKLSLKGQAEAGNAYGDLTASADLKNVFAERIAHWFESKAPVLRRAKAEGNALLKGHVKYNSSNGLAASGQLNLNASNLEFPSRDLYLTGAELNLPLEYPGTPNWGNLAVKSLEFHSIKLKNFSLQTRLGTEGVDLSTESQNGDDVPIKQTVWGGTVDIENLYAHFAKGMRPQFTASISGGPFKLSEIQADLCLMPNRPLKGTVAFHYPQIVEEHDVIRLVGDTNFIVLGGNAHIGDLSFSFQEQSPRLKFEADWSDLDFATIGEWSNFGDMRGSLDGSITNTTVAFTPLGPMPLRYDLVFKGKGRGGNKMSFYGRAMDNIMAAIGTPKDQLPWMAMTIFNIAQAWRNWLPAKAEVFGFKAKSDGEWTELSTFDPPAEAQTLCSPQKHYLLCGHGFTIPLNTYGVYPVVMKTDAFHQWLAGFSKYMKQVIKNGKKQNPNQISVNPSEPQCTPFF